ncbi:SCO family protein [Arenicella sp. 4NH20-0111]|uniref:SCO family protein n=1 Tax=Arenicella sp. 4NH20-0111 TaxID=3127648 RepID=UPI0031076644
MNKIAKVSMAAIGLILALVIALFVVTSESSLAEKPQSFSDLGGDFTLTSASGPVALSDFQDKVVVLYFGFLTCPEVCPNSMSVIQGALSRLETTQLDSVQAVLVSVDPNRDSPQQLAEYTQFYHENLVGLTGSKKQIDAVTRQYGAFYDFNEIESSTSDYGVEHSSRYYVINPKGALVAAMRHSTTSNELTAQIQELL